MWVKCKTKDPRENENLGTVHIMYLLKSSYATIFNPGSEALNPFMHQLEFFLKKISHLSKMLNVKMLTPGC